MNRRDFLKTTCAGALAAIWPASAGLARPPARKPNIILIMADDLGYGDLGCYGNETISTPNLDALAAGGVRFTDFHSNGAVCSPTRAALLTGRYQQRCGIEGVVTAKNHRHTGMALEETTFAEVLKTAGYTTALFGKWHLGYPADLNPTKQGFDTFRGYVSGNVDYHSHIDQEGYEDWWDGCEKVPEDGYSTDLITEHGVRFIERHKNESFCLYLPHEAPHYPYQGRNDKADRTPGNGRPTHGTREDKAGAYKEMTEAMDEGVGRIVDTIRRLGLERNTFIFFCSDNGATPLGSNGRLRGHKGTLWEGGHRVPAIAYWPGTIEPGVTHETALTMDLFPTMAAIAGAPVPAGLHLDGVNLLPMLTGKGRLPERTLFWRTNRQKAVRKGPWKLLVETQRKKGGERPAGPQLFNLETNLAEQKDLSQTEKDRVDELLHELTPWEQDVSSGVTQVT